MTVCAEFLKNQRKLFNVPKEDKIDKRYHGVFGWLAPDDIYYKGHCGHCAESAYIQSKYGRNEEVKE